MLKFVLFWCIALSLCGIAAAGEVKITLSVLPGLRYDKVRLVVKPGDIVHLTFTNPDQMIHNWVLTEPGARLEIVNAAMLLGGDAPAKQFIPDSKKILVYTKALNPGGSETLTFTAPAKEDVYPYVCTFIGHGFIMYGALYVTGKAESELPPLDKDPNLPPPLPTAMDHSHHQPLTIPKIQRTFLPDCGPAAIAVGLPGAAGQSFCFDAGSCRLRYAWKGGFIDPTKHLLGKGEEFTQVVGRIYYRATAGFPLRLGDISHVPKTQWRGYQLIEGYPQFRYEIDGIEVREITKPAATGNGLMIHYQIPSAPGEVYYVIDPAAGAGFTSSAGSWANGVLKLTAAQAKSFDLTLTEIPGREPIAYWSLNDQPAPNKDAPPPGVVGRAFTPGLGKSPKPVEAGVNTSELKNGGTLALWFKLDKPETKDQYLLAAGENAKDCLVLGVNLDGPGVGFMSVGGGGSGKLTQKKSLDNQWHHLAASFGHEQTTLYLDGQKLATSAGTHLINKDAPITLGSLGKTFLKGTLDEVRIWNRVVSDAEIAEIFRRERAAQGQVQ